MTAQPAGMAQRPEGWADRIAVVTGGTSGIGRTTAKALAATGANVVIAGRDHDRGRAVSEEIAMANGSVTFVPVDVRDDAAVAALAQRALDEFGGVDIWVNNAGVEGPGGDPLAFDEEAVRATFETNLKGVYSGIRHAAAAMGDRGGVIVNLAAFVGTRAFPPPAIVYSASKAGVVAMTAAAAGLLADRNIQVYAVCPCVVDTPLVDRVTGGAGEGARREFAAMVAPSRSLSEPEDVARVVVELCSGGAGYASGDAIVVDAGGRTEPL